MKIKQTLMISGADNFMRGNYRSCFTLVGYECGIPGWIDCGEIELDVDVKTGEVINTIVAAVDEQIKAERAEFAVKINILEARKNELLALTHEDQS